MTKKEKIENFIEKYNGEGAGSDVKKPELSSEFDSG